MTKILETFQAENWRLFSFVRKGQKENKNETLANERMKK